MYSDKLFIPTRLFPVDNSRLRVFRITESPISPNVEIDSLHFLSRLARFPDYPSPD